VGTQKKKSHGWKADIAEAEIKKVPNLVIKGIIQTLIVQGDNKLHILQDYSPWVSFLAFFP
jgi:hypothetical protein